MASKIIFMKRILILLVGALLAIASCETDEICDQTIQPTPNLVITFYDIDNPETRKEVIGFSAKLLESQEVITTTDTDSIQLPLDVFNLTTSYQFLEGETVDDIKLTYTSEQIFMSQSCGYRTQFNNLENISTSNWIQKISVEETTINDQKTEHVKIYH